MSDRISWRRIGLLVLLATLVQGWMVHRNAVPAQDSVVFVQFARQFTQQPFADTLRRNMQHPLYPLLVCGHHQLFGGLLGPEGIGWIRSAQWVAAVAAILLVIPMYLAGTRLADPLRAMAATALFTMLPITARMGADGLSESTYLLFFLIGFWACTEFLVTHQKRWLLLAGFGAGLAFLARPEAMLLPLALVATLAVLQMQPSGRISCSRLAAGVMCLAAGSLSVAAPYMMATGKITPKTSLRVLAGRIAIGPRQTTPADDGTRTALLSDGQVIRLPIKLTLPSTAGETLDFGLKHRPAGSRLDGYGAASSQLLRELIEGLQYVFALLILVGLIRSPRGPAHQFVSMLSLVFAAVLVHFACHAGYLSHRHVITLVCLGAYVAARGGWLVVEALSRLWWRTVSSTHAQASGMSSESAANIRLRLAGLLMIFSCAICTPRSLAPLHQSRQAHVQAGRWLAEHAEADSIVLDSRGWAALLSGLPSYNYNGARVAFEDPRLAYVVVEKSEVDDPRARGETLRRFLDTAGQKLVEFRGNPTDDQSVLVYRWNPERLAEAVHASRQSPRAN